MLGKLIGKVVAEVVKAPFEAVEEVVKITDPPPRKKQRWL